MVSTTAIILDRTVDLYIHFISSLWRILKRLRITQFILHYFLSNSLCVILSKSEYTKKKKMDDIFFMFADYKKLRKH